MIESSLHLLWFSKTMQEIDYSNIPSAFSIKALEESLGLNENDITVWKRRKHLWYDEPKSRGQTVFLNRENILKVIVISLIRQETIEKKGENAQYSADVKIAFAYSDWLEDYANQIMEVAEKCFRPRVIQ